MRALLNFASVQNHFKQARALCNRQNFQLGRTAVTAAMCGDDKAGAVRAIGPAAVLSRRPDNFKVALRKAIGRDTVTVIADVVDGPN